MFRSVLKAAKPDVGVEDVLRAGVEDRHAAVGLAVFDLSAVDGFKDEASGYCSFIPLV